MFGEIDTKLHVDNSGDSFTIIREQDVEAIIERNKYLQTVGQNSDWGRHVATIPNIFLEKWLREEWDRGNVHLRLFTPEMDQLCDRKLKDPEWKFLRSDKSESGIAGWSAGLVA
jgi:hypothetical protein